MGNFGTDTFDTESFEKHATKLLTQILGGNQRLAAITSKETHLMANKTLLRKLNDELSPSISEMIREMSTYVYPSDIALLLIAAHQDGLLDQAQEILDSVMQERRLMSLNDLLGALAESSKMPGSWAASLFGEMDSERDAVPTVVEKKPTIDLSAMQRGMGF